MELDAMINAFAKGMSDRIIDEVHTKERSLVSYVCPIYCERSSHRLSHVGSAILIQISDSKLILSAAHVLESRNEGTLLIPGNHGLTPISGIFSVTDVHGGSTTKSDRFDFAFCRLAQEIADAVVAYSFLPITEIRPDDQPTFGKLYTFVGYPHSMNKVGYRVKPAPFSFLNTPLSLDLYKHYGIDSQTQIAVKYEKKRTLSSDRSPATTPEPSGLSGGGLWTWEIFDRLKLGRPEVAPKLVGITVGRTKDGKAWLATKIGIVLESMRSSYPELDRSIPRMNSVHVNIETA